MNDHWRRVSLWFEEVCDLPPAEGRARLEAGCPDRRVRDDVLGLLDAAERAERRLTPAESYRRSLEDTPLSLPRAWRRLRDDDGSTAR